MVYFFANVQNKKTVVSLSPNMMWMNIHKFLKMDFNPKIKNESSKIWRLVYVRCPFGKFGTANH